MPVPKSLYFLPLIAIMTAILVLVACGSDEPALPDTTAASLMAYLDEVDYDDNEEWRLWPGSSEKYPGEDPHGALLTIRMNDAAFNAVGGTMPDGAIIVKENYSPAGDLGATTVMYKKSGYNPDHSDWFWVKELADGTIEKEGKVMGCQDCHVDGTDYVWGPQQ